MLCSRKGKSTQREASAGSERAAHAEGRERSKSSCSSFQTLGTRRSSTERRWAGVRKCQHLSNARLCLRLYGFYIERPGTCGVRLGPNQCTSNINLLDQTEETNNHHDIFPANHSRRSVDRLHNEPIQRHGQQHDQFPVWYRPRQHLCWRYDL